MADSIKQTERFFLTNGSRVIELRRGRIRLGRAGDCDVQVRDIRSSRHHCEIIAQEGGLFVRDMGSTNGTFVNGEAVEFTRLQLGDVLSVAGESFLLDSQPREMWQRLAQFTNVFAKLRVPAVAVNTFSGSV